MEIKIINCKRHNIINIDFLFLNKDITKLIKTRKMLTILATKDISSNSVRTFNLLP